MSLPLPLTKAPDTTSLSARTCEELASLDPTLSLEVAHFQAQQLVPVSEAGIYNINDQGMTNDMTRVPQLVPPSIGDQSVRTLSYQNQPVLLSTSRPYTHSEVGANELGSASDLRLIPLDWQFLDNSTDSSRDRQRFMPYVSDTSWMMPSGESDSTSFGPEVNSHIPSSHVLTQIIPGSGFSKAISGSTVPSWSAPAQVADGPHYNAVGIEHVRASPMLQPAPRVQASSSKAHVGHRGKVRELEIVLCGQEEPARKQRKRADLSTGEVSTINLECV